MVEKIWTKWSIDVWNEDYLIKWEPYVDNAGNTDYTKTTPRAIWGWMNTCIHYRTCTLHVLCVYNLYIRPMGEFRSSLYMNFWIFNLDFEPEDKIKMRSCLRGVYKVFNNLSDDVSIVRIHNVDQKLWFFEIINFEFS